MLAAFAWPGQDLPSPSTGLPLDKFVHIALFAGFGALWMQTMTRASLRHRAAWVFAAGLLLAVLTEAGQHLFTSGRTASGLDILADFVGLIAGIAVFWLAGRRGLLPERSKQKPPTE